MKPTYDELLQENRALKKIVSKNDFIERVFQSLENSVMILNPDQDILSVNYATEKITGLSNKEIVGKKCHQIFHGADTAHSRCPMQTMLNSGKIETRAMEIQALGKIYLISCSPVFDENDNLIRIIHIGTDITKQKDKEATFQAITDSAMDSIFCKNLERKYTFVNPAMIKLLGCKKEDLLGKTPEQIFDQDAAATIFEVDQRSLTGEKVNEVRSLKIGNDLFTFHTIQVPLYDSYGKIVGISGIVRDLTENKIAEEEQRATEQNLLEAQRVAKLGSWTWNTNSDVVQCSKEMLRIWGYSIDRGTLSFEEVTQRIHPDDRQKVIKKLQNAIESQARYEAEFRIITPDGATRFISGMGHVVHNNKGEPPTMYGTGQDITDRKQAEKALIESEMRYRALFDFNPIQTIVVDSQGQIIMYNFARERSSLRLPSIGSVMYKNYASKHEIDMYKELMECIRTGKQKVFQELKYKQKFLKIQIAPFTHGAIITSEDITERKNLQGSLEQAQKMEAIGTLAGGIAHDFNNILSSILGFSELALTEVEKGSDLEDDLQEIRNAGLRAKDLVKQILAFARQSDEEVRPMQVCVIVKEVLRLIRSSAPTTIEIEQKLESDSFIMASPTQIHQVLMNLSTNAIQAMEENGGTLDVKVKDIVVDHKPGLDDLKLKPGHYVQIQISDTGIGIPQQNLDSIFDPYFTTKKMDEGTGLGLAVVHGLIESCNGKIMVKSSLGHSTTFTVFLPITKKRRNTIATEREELPTGNENILFIDDEAPIAKMAKKILSQLGYSATIRTSSIEALELFKQKSGDFDLVITDMTMPNMTGDELAVEFLKIRADIPVILCTGYSKKISEEASAEIGIRAFANKPLVVSDLSKTIRKVLDETKS